MGKRVSDEWLDSQINAYGTLGGNSETASALKELQRLRAKLGAASQYVEGPIAMRTKFDGNDPYRGWKGLGLAMEEAFDERDELRDAQQQQRELVVKWREEADAIQKVLSVASVEVQRMRQCASELEAILKGTP